MAGHDTLIERAIAAYERVYRGMVTRGDCDSWLNLELTMAQCKVLLFLAQAGAVPISGVADALRIGRPAGSTLVDRLVQQGLVQRAEDPADRRRTLAKLTRKGAELVADLQQGRSTQFRQYIEQMADSDLAALAQGAEALASVLEDELVPEGDGRWG